MKHLVIIPTYNEAENVEAIVRKIFELYPNINILIVDDSSPDGTSNIVKKLQKEFSLLHLLIRDKKEGLAKAYIAGFNWGIENNFSVFTSFDADFSHDPKYIKNAIEMINSGCDVVCASRYVNKGYSEEQNFFKKYISVLGNLYIKTILGNKIKDWTGGFNTYTKYAVEKINLNTISVKGYIFQTQMKYRAVKEGCKYGEFPICFKERTKGKSKMTASIIIEAFISIIKIRLGK